MFFFGRSESLRHERMRLCMLRVSHMLFLKKNQRLKVDAKLACIRIRNWLVEVRRYSVCLSGDIANSRFL